MGVAFADMLPYSVGRIVSPFPVIAVILLLVSKGGWRKSVIFEIAWLVISYATLLVIALIAGSAHGSDGQPKGGVSILMFVIGLVLLGLVGATFVKVARHGNAGPQKPPKWLGAVDRMSTPEVAGLAAVLVLVNPVNLASIAGAGIVLANETLPTGQTAVVTGIFVVIASLSVLAPFLGRLIGGTKSEPTLARVRLWLVAHKNALSGGLTLVFAVLFIAKGLRGMLE